jgi:FKBP-type peptidyl-prolyl cis-trans isomerase
MKSLLFALTFLFIGSSAFSQDAKKTVTASGLTYISLVPGDGKSPSDGDKVKCYYIARLSTGKVFEDVDKAQFTVGSDKLIPGFNEALKLMKEGERAKFIMPPNIAYGEKGNKDLGKNYIVPPNETISFEIVLQKVK